MLRRLSLLVAFGAVGLVVGLPSAAAGGGCHAPADVGITSGKQTAALVSECSFQPTVTYVQPGDSVTWTNKDIFDHTVTGAGYSWGSEDPLTQGQTVTYAFKDEGVFPYYCAYHPSMVGAVVVGDATKAASLTGGFAAVDEVDPGSGSTSDQAPVSTGTSEPNTSIVLALAAFAVIAIAAVAWRAVNVRRRASAAPAP